jgi:hypothetical protein
VVLGHPVVVDAAETLFEAIGLRNNAKGTYDDEIRKRFREGAWAYPVARFVDADGKDIVPRTQGDWRNADALLKRMVAALEAAKRPVPAWLRLVAAEYNAANRKTTLMKAPDAPAARAVVDAIDGVLATRITSIGEAPALEVVHDAAVVTGAQIEGAIRRLPKPKALLRESRLRWIPMSGAQACRVNAALALGADPARFLSPDQIALSRRIVEASPEAFEDLEIDRSRKGLPAYAARLRAALAAGKGDGE